MPGLALKMFRGRSTLTPDANIDEIALRTGDGGLRLNALPQSGANLKLTLTSVGWRMPWRGGIPIDSIEAEGLLSRNALRVERCEPSDAWWDDQWLGKY